jgi:Tfp pilus assembly protein PilX
MNRTVVNKSHPRRGMVAVVVLLSMAIGAGLLMTALQLAADMRRAADAESRRLQAQWLAESAVERAAARLASDGGYSGETWNIPASELGGRAAAVEIRAETVAGDGDARLVSVRADFPNAPWDRARVVKNVTVKLHNEPKTTENDP